MSRHRHKPRWDDPALHRDPDLWDLDSLPRRSSKNGGCGALVAVLLFLAVLIAGATSGMWLR